MNYKKVIGAWMLLSSILFLPASAPAQSSIEYDIVLSGGRVIDPETKLDTINNAGIIDNRIAQITSGPLKGKETINVSGLAVGPGFVYGKYKK